MNDYWACACGVGKKGKIEKKKDIISNKFFKCLQNKSSVYSFIDTYLFISIFIIYKHIIYLLYNYYYLLSI